MKQPTSLSTPVNNEEPIRIACLGGPRTGKTSFVSKITSGSARETYYPSRKTTPMLFTFWPQTATSKTFLDDTCPKETLQKTVSHEQLVLSPVIYRSLVSAASAKDAPATASTANDYYVVQRTDNEPKISPILVELVDTPAFNVDTYIPFLEASLHAKLGKDVLKKLADEPRQPVNAEPLLVASGAGEMNGTIEGYFFFYSAVPSEQPPMYDDIDSDVSPVSSSSSEHKPKSLGGNTSLDLLPTMKEGLSEAWREYHTYKTRWEKGKETDMFSLKSALKTIFETQNQKNRTINSQLLDISNDPADSSSLPPIWIICTHKNSPLASPKLIEEGMALAREWKCGFYAMDVMEEVESVLALMIRDIAERKTLQKRRRR